MSNTKYWFDNVFSADEENSTPRRENVTVGQIEEWANLEEEKLLEPQTFADAYRKRKDYISHLLHDPSVSKTSIN